jgi:hypothetical protein
VSIGRKPAAEDVDESAEEASISIAKEGTEEGED